MASPQNHRITIPYFRTWSTCMSHSQAPICYCTPRTVTIRAEEQKKKETSVTLLEATTPVKLPTKRCPLPEVRTQIHKGPYFNVGSRTAWRPASKPPAYPHFVCPNSALSYSKGSRGLFVPLRVPGIITGTTISPSSRLRQCPDRYTIRAGRNLPDKEFRYLRTVIVTAAVYWGFDSMLLLR